MDPSLQHEHHRKLERMYAAAPINRYYAPILHVEDGAATVRMTVGEHLFHSAGGMHGSVYFKALDDAAWFAVNSQVHDVFVLTATFEVTLLRPVSTGTITAKGWVVAQHDGRIEAAAELFDDQGRCIARGSGQFARGRTPLSPAVHYA